VASATGGIAESKREKLEQTATAEILKLMSGSPTDVQPVFEAILTNALRLCEASFAAMFTYDGELLRNVAHRNASRQFARFLHSPGVRPSRETTTRRCALERRTIHTPDLINDPEFCPPEAQRREKVRTALSVPMFREGELVGVITLWRGQVRPFSDKQIALVETFAAQAVIAIENVRLFNETREALEQQKALAEVLGTISRSVADARPVFDLILDSCQRLFEGHLVGMTLLGEDGMIRLGAYQGENKEAMERVYPYPLGRDSGSGQAILERRVAHFPDVDAPGSHAPPRVLDGSRAVGFKSIVFAPLATDERALGALWVGRRLAGPFSEREIALLRTFADQAVIAIRNASLFREIQEKGRQLEIASRHKSEFLASMSHELRTPLNAIIGFTRIVMRKSKEALPEIQYENLEKILASSQQLLALINAVLDLSKVEAGKVVLQPREVELAPVLEQCLRTIEPLSRVALVNELEGGLPRMYVDEEKLAQIIMNLLSNAAKFTERGTIRLGARAADGSVTITVADTGIGIAPDKLGLIFEEFEQADAGATGVYGGTGLGLTIARRLARLMGGDIGVDSTPGAGSRFTLTLPVRCLA
jgi:signal transduction histidine kinase